MVLQTTTYKELEYAIREKEMDVLVTGPPSILQKFIRGVAKEKGARIDSGIQQVLDDINDYVVAPQYFDGSFSWVQLNFGMHRIGVQSDDSGLFFEEGKLMVSYLYNDAGDPDSDRRGHFEGIKQTFKTVLERYL